jgi:hypothetical protein
MTSKKRHVPYIGFSITDHCNLNCTHCNTLSNFSLTGHQLWSDYKHTIEQWGERIELDEWNIYGGEPTLNPSFEDWIHGLFENWPNSKGEIWTNGYTIKSQNTKLYNLVKNNSDRLQITVSLHSRKDFGTLYTNIMNWLSGPVTITRENPKDGTSTLSGRVIMIRTSENETDHEENWKKSYNNIRGADWPDCDKFSDWENLPDGIKEECITQFNLSPEIFLDQEQGYKLVDNNGVVVWIQKHHMFRKGPLVVDHENNKISLRNSDAIKAHTICISSGCTEMYKGELYKCSTVSKFPTFENQYNLDISDSDKEIIRSIKSANIDMSDSELNLWLDNRYKVIDQCKFCSEDSSYTEIFPTTKKIKFIKKNQ